LRDVGDAVRLLARRRTEDPDRACPDRQQAGDDLEKRALARAIGADDGQQRAPVDGQIDVVERDPCPVSGRDIGELDRPFRRYRSASAI
jgi:hypothetical protein